MCNDTRQEAAYEKVALFAVAGEPMHVAGQRAGGSRTSKVGPMEDIEHRLRELEGDIYGNVAVLFKRAVRNGDEFPFRSLRE